MVVVGDARQHRHGLALRARADEHDLVVGQVREVIDGHEHAAGHGEVAEVARDTHVAHHRAPDEGDLAPVLGSRIDDLLDPMHVRGEARHDHPTARPVEDLVQHRRDLALARDEARHLGVGRVDEEEIDALVAEAREAVEVGDPAVERQLVHLEIAGMQDKPRGGANRHGQRVGDGVVDREELQVERADREPLPLGDDMGHGLDARFAQLGLGEGQREARAVEGDVRALAQQEGQRADVILVPVREDDRVHLVEAVLQVGEVRKDEVDSGLGLLGEEHSAVDDEQSSGVLEDRHVAADLAETAERDDAHRTFGQGWWCRQFGMCVTHDRSTPPSRRSRSSCSICVAVASTSGARTGPAGSPCRRSAALVRMTPCVRKIPV